ncbi:MAG: HAD family hydrolase [Lentimicrobiaceae bacterium]|nr:HAD family hydrolase [Lentimicrobiaceae bacterium]MBT7036569.1 HAD family hydrolase [Lentimicrobiaceae bacterium]
MHKKKHIIWDWNGTLLNDTQYCVSCMNKVLSNHQLENITIDIYKKHFTFPVKDYYRAIGFDFNKIDFEKPALEFINEYYSGITSVKLHKGCHAILNTINQKGIKQHVLSAMEHNMLVKSLSNFGIDSYFENVSGISDHYAHSKVDVGKKLISEIGCSTDDIIMIGDTIHDYEVAQNLEIDCLLISSGHQSHERLETRTSNIISKLSEIEVFLG